MAFIFVEYESRFFFFFPPLDHIFQLFVINVLSRVSVFFLTLKVINSHFQRFKYLLKALTIFIVMK